MADNQNQTKKVTESKKTNTPKKEQPKKSQTTKNNTKTKSGKTGSHKIDNNKGSTKTTTKKTTSKNTKSTTKSSPKPVTKKSTKKESTNKKEINTDTSTSKDIKIHTTKSTNENEKVKENKTEKKEILIKKEDVINKTEKEEKKEIASFEKEIQEELQDLKKEQKKEMKQEHVEHAIADIFTGDYLDNTMINTPRNVFKREIEKPEDKPKKEIPKSFWPILGLAIVLSIVSIFTIHHFITFNHHPKEKPPETLETLSPSYLFLGDSITEQYHLKDHFKNYKVVNSGRGGYTTKDILDHIEEMAYDYNPSKIFLLIGTNDVSREVSEKEIINNIKKIITELQKNLPKATLYVESIYPTSFDSTSKIRSINKAIKEYCKENEINFIDLYSLLQNRDQKIESKYTKDGTHLTEDGYDIVTQKILSYLPEKEENSK